MIIILLFIGILSFLLLTYFYKILDQYARKIFKTSLKILGEEKSLNFCYDSKYGNLQQ